LKFLDRLISTVCPDFKIMKSIKAISIVLVILFFSLTAFSQLKLNGKVIEVIDGKTAVVQIGTSGNLRVVLQYVEIPEPEQPLHSIVKNHLEKLLLGKNALVIPRGVVESSTVAQVFVGGVDVSQQMIRDGAAWFALPEKTEKSGSEIEVYLSNEAQARSEKRGVWSIEGLKPAWQFRAEKRERERAEELAELEEIKKQKQQK
jgi:endonuclease YncB( thermonuclease family)